jgi:uncharacterized membrane protein YdfJ with MMPL/SSD domain
MKQLGVGLAAAILIDATVVRAVLLPATMKLLDKRNWYLPSWLEWLPHVSAEPSVEAVPSSSIDTDAHPGGVRTPQTAPAP